MIHSVSKTKAILSIAFNLSLIAFSDAAMVPLVSLPAVAPVSWDVDSNASFFAVSIPDFSIPDGPTTTTIRVRNASGTGSVWNTGNQTQISGRINTMYDQSNDSAIQFLPQANLVGLLSGTYRPNPSAWNGTEYTNTNAANANLGARVNGLTYGINYQIGFLAARNMLFDLTSANQLSTTLGGSISSLNAAGNAFGVRSMDVDFDGFYVPAFDYQPVSDSHETITQMTALGTGTMSSGVIEAGSFGAFNRKMTLNFSVPIQFTLNNLTLNGTATSRIVAYAVPEPTTVTLAMFAAASLAVFACRGRT
jgi:hypothetical protein